MYSNFRTQFDSNQHIQLEALQFAKELGADYIDIEFEVIITHILSI